MGLEPPSRKGIAALAGLRGALETCITWKTSGGGGGDTHLGYGILGGKKSGIWDMRAKKSGMWDMGKSSGIWDIGVEIFNF